MNLIRHTNGRIFDFPFDRIFDDFWPRQQADSNVEQAVFAPRVDIREGQESISLSAELPGVDQDAVKVELENGVLTISGEKKSELSEEENGFYRSERVYGAFKRSFRVPETVNPEQINAEYSNGVLRVTLPKRPEAAPRQITVKQGTQSVKQINAK